MSEIAANLRFSFGFFAPLPRSKPLISRFLPHPQKKASKAGGGLTPFFPDYNFFEKIRGVSFLFFLFFAMFSIITEIIFPLKNYIFLSFSGNFIWDEFAF